MSVVTLCVVGAAALFSLIMFAKMAGEAKPGYAFAVFWLGVAGAITASIMAMTRPRGAAAGVGMPLRPMGPPLGYPPAHFQLPMPQVQQGMPCPTCHTPTIWVAQYNRWFCQRCNQYP